MLLLARIGGLGLNIELFQTSLASSSSLSGSVGNIAKPLTESGAVPHQIIPMKLSQAADASFRKASPKSTYHKLSSYGDSSQQQHAYPTASAPSPMELGHQRTGSSPALMPLAVGGAASVGVSVAASTLPKSSSLSSRDVQRVNYGGGDPKDEGNVIYF